MIVREKNIILFSFPVIHFNLFLLWKQDFPGNIFNFIYTLFLFYVKWFTLNISVFAAIEMDFSWKAKMWITPSQLLFKNNSIKTILDWCSVFTIQKREQKILILFYPSVIFILYMYIYKHILKKILIPKIVNNNMMAWLWKSTREKRPIFTDLVGVFTS